jgi:adenosine kinase
MDILLTGSIAFDYIMTFPGYFRDHLLPDRLHKVSLSFLVDSLVRMRGGVAPNIAYTLALLGQRPRLWATVGEDFEDYRAFLEKSGVDTAGVKVIEGEKTASFFANIDQSNAQIASFYPGAMAYAGRFPLSMVDPTPDVIVISPNDPGAMRSFILEAKELSIPYLYDPSQQTVRLTGDELAEGVSGAAGVFVNDYEAALIEKMTGITPESFVTSKPLTKQAFMVVTRGKEGASVYTHAGEIFVKTAPEGEVIDPTGVGDAFRGGFLTGYSLGLPWEVCGRMRSIAAVYCLERKGTQAHFYTPEDFVRRYAEAYGEDDGLSTWLVKL